MASLDDLIDIGRFARDRVLGYQTMQRIRTNLALLSDVFQLRHLADGEINSRRVAREATYVWNGSTKYLLDGQDEGGIFPTEVTPSSTGDLTITFVTARAADTYGIVVGAGMDVDGHPGVAGASFGAADRTTAACRVLLCNAGSGAPENIDGFTVLLFEDAA